MKKRIRHLQVGDILSSGAKIIERSYDSVRCPKGKCNIGVEYSDGTRKIQQWGKDTEVSLK
jgi:hypothetical protein